MNRFKTVMLGVVAVLASAVVAAPAMAQEVYLQGGTQGGGIGASIGVTSWLGFHADIDGMNISHSFHAGGNKFDGELHVRHEGVYADLFPFPRSGFRISAGAMFSQDRLTGTAVPENGNYKIGGYTVPAGIFAGQTASVTAKFPAVMPYLGFGYGHQPLHKGFGFVADVGVAYGKPSVGFSVPPQLTQYAASPLAQEEQEIRNSIQKVKFFPVVQVGISYRF